MAGGSAGGDERSARTLGAGWLAAGIALLPGIIKVADLQSSPLVAIYTQGWFWILIWGVLGAAGVIAQLQMTARMEQDLVGTYAKRHLVPFGEYVPWRDSLGFISELQQIPHDFTPGHRIGIETVAGHKIGSVICFESAFGPLMRANAAAGALVAAADRRNEVKVIGGWGVVTTADLKGLNPAANWSASRGYSSRAGWQRFDYSHW